MTKLTVTPFSVKQAEQFSKEDLVENIVVGSNEFGLRITNEFSIAEIKELTKLGKKIWVSVNKLMHQSDVEKLRSYLIELSKLDIFGLIFSDLSVYEIVRENNYPFELVYSTETTITNSFFTDFANEFNIFGVELAKEISLKKVVDIANNKKSAVSINIHGHIYMYQSVRKMISNYSEVINKDLDINNKFHLYDNERDMYYPIIENAQGTHVIASKDLCMINKLDDLMDVNVDYFKLDGFLYTEDGYFKIVNLYIECLTKLLNDQEINLRSYFKQLKEIDKTKSYNTGFYYKETVF